MCMPALNHRLQALPQIITLHSSSSFQNLRKDSFVHIDVAWFSSMDSLVERTGEELFDSNSVFALFFWILIIALSNCCTNSYHCKQNFKNLFRHAFVLSHLCVLLISLNKFPCKYSSTHLLRFAKISVTQWFPLRSNFSTISCQAFLNSFGFSRMNMHLTNMFVKSLIYTFVNAFRWRCHEHMQWHASGMTFFNCLTHFFIPINYYIYEFLIHHCNKKCFQHPFICSNTFIHQ